MNMAVDKLNRLAELNYNKFMSGPLSSEVERERLSLMEEWKYSQLRLLNATSGYIHTPTPIKNSDLDSADSKLPTNSYIKEEIERSIGRIYDTNTGIKDSPLNTQIGGDHYKKLKIQPIEYIQANSLGFEEGCIIKYITRWKEKGGIKDLEKIKHFVDLMIAFVQKETDPVNKALLDQFNKAKE